MENDSVASNLDSILASARANAANLVPAVPNTNLPAQPQASKLLDFDDLGGSFSVDLFLKVTDAGIKIGGKGGFHEKLYVHMDTAAVQASKALSASSNGSSPKYWRTYDGIVTLQGQPWGEAIAEALRIKPDASPYSSADIPVRLAAEVDGVGPDKLLGISLSKSNFGAFDAFRKSLIRQGLWGQEVPVVLGYKVGQMKGVRDWGMFTFQLFDPDADTAE